MKKTMQFLFALSMIMEGQNSFAGTPETASILDKPESITSTKSSAKGIQYLILTVTDDLMKPIQGDTVNAPCTGQKPALTNTAGVAEFSYSGSCPCSGAPAYITTKTCDVEISINCSTDNPVICN